MPLGLVGAFLLVLGLTLESRPWSAGCVGAGGGLLVESGYLLVRGHPLGQPRPRQGPRCNAERSRLGDAHSAVDAGVHVVALLGRSVSRMQAWQPPPRWLAVGPVLGELGVALTLVDGEANVLARWFSVAVVVANLALALAIVLWPRRGGRSS